MKLDLTKVTTVIATCPGEIWLKRLSVVYKMLNDLKFENVTASMGEVTEPYVFGANNNAIKILSNNKVPFIYMEDDATLLPENYHNELDIPDECDILFLGGSTHANAHFITQDKSILYNKGYGVGKTRIAYKPINEDFVRIYNMFCIHAVLFLTEKGRLSFLETIQRFKHLILDVLFSFEMPNINCYLVKQPFFYQNDGHNNTFTKQIIYDGSTMVDVEKALLLKKQHPLEGIQRIHVTGRGPSIIKNGIF